MHGSDTSLRALEVAWVVLVGAAIGSFLNVVIARVPRGASIVRPGSRCPRCGAAIAWYDNVPVVSWLVLRGRCRACHTRISVRYPAVELLGAGAALLAWHRHGLGGAAAAELAFVAALVALALIDLDTWLLPHAITWPLIAFGVGASAFGISATPSLTSSLWGAGLGFGVFALVAWAGARVFKKEALGFGDVWLLTGLGAWLGAGALLPIVLLASIQGSVVGIALMVLGRAQPGPAKNEPSAGGSPLALPSPPEGEGIGRGGALAADEDDWVPPRNAVPFGPFLAVAALEWLYLSGAIAALVPALEVFR
jgi:leader peptidase (prepilin peptidase) / N-methyltransferase